METKVKNGGRDFYSLPPFDINLTLSFISHCRINYFNAVVCRCLIKEITDIVNLLCTSKIACIDSIKFNAFFYKVLLYGRHIICKITKGVSLKAVCVS